MTKIAFFDTKSYDLVAFPWLSKVYGVEINFFGPKLSKDTVMLASGFDVVCVSANDVVDREVIDELVVEGVSLVALRCSGCSNVDVDYADGRIALAPIPHFLITEALENIAMATIENVVSYYE